MTAADYRTDAEFLAWCRVWLSAGRCPLPFADWLRDRGLDLQADAAAWAAVQPDRYGVNNIWGGVRPAPVLEGKSVYWLIRPGCAVDELHRSDLPVDLAPFLPWPLPHSRTGPVYIPDQPTAITVFLDAWAAARAPAAARR